jgi:hypothetical protein
MRQRPQPAPLKAPAVLTSQWTENERPIYRSLRTRATQGPRDQIPHDGPRQTGMADRIRPERRSPPTRFWHSATTPRFPWFRLDNVRGANIDQTEIFPEADPAGRRHVKAELDGFHKGGLCSFVVWSPSVAGSSITRRSP